MLTAIQMISITSDTRNTGIQPTVNTSANARATHTFIPGS